MTTNEYDIIIIGTGAGGGTMAHALASTGKKILVLERGDFLPKETDNWNPEAVGNGIYKTTEMWLDSFGQEFSPYQHYWVGGNTKVYGGALLRLREKDFEKVKHYGGNSPEWEIKYKEWEQWYTRAEQMYSAHGERGIDPTDPPASSEYPFPPLKAEPRMLEIMEGMRKQGLHPAPVPLGVRLGKDAEVETYSQDLSLFDGYPDPSGVKADSHVVGINYALSFKNVTLLRNRKAIKIGTTPDGKKAAHVVVEHENELEAYYGKLIILSCGAINSAALLLKSSTDQHPNGLANSSGLVGCNLMLHNNGAVLAHSAKLNSSKFQKSFLVSDFYFGAYDSTYPLGTIQTMGKPDPVFLKDALGDDYKPGTDLKYFSDRNVDFFITSEDLPQRENCVKVNKDGRIQIFYTPNNLEAYERLKKKLIQIMDMIAKHEGVAGTTKYYGFKLGIGGVSHQSGTCVFGSDPKNSVLDLNCKAHDLENLYVIDTSFFPSSGAVNPSLTVIANALRVAEHLKNNVI